MEYVIWGLGAIALLFVWLAGRVLSSLIASDIRDYCDDWAERISLWAARRMPPEQAEIWESDWIASIRVTKGKLMKLRFAFGTVFASYSMSFSAKPAARLQAFKTILISLIIEDFKRSRWWDTPIIVISHIISGGLVSYFFYSNVESKLFASLTIGAIPLAIVAHIFMYRYIRDIVRRGDWG